MAARRRLVLAGLGLAVASLAFGVGRYPLLDPDEGRNAEVMREMAVSNEYLLPRLNTLPYVDKPLLFFVSGAAFMELLGPTELAARLPSLLFTLGTLATVWWFGRYLFGPDAGAAAAIMTAASPLTLAFARTVIFDSALTFFSTVAVVAFYLAAERTAGRLDGWSVSEEKSPTVQPSNRPTVRGGTSWWPAIAWGAMGLGVLTKGPVALALPLMIAVPYLVWRRAWRVALDPVGLLLFLALILPWVRYMSIQVPDYLRYVFQVETFQRMATPALQRTGPWWYFMPILLAGALPWSVMALANRRTGGTVEPRMALLALWVLVPLLFFSLSQSKRPQYVLPLVPAIALIVAATWNERRVLFGAVTVGAFGAVLLVAYPWIPSLIRNVAAGTAAEIPRTALPLGIVCLVAGVTAALLRRRREVALLALSLPVISIPVISGSLMREIGRDRSAHEMAQAIAPLLTDPAEIVGAGAYPLSLPFYLRRTMVLSTESGRELTSNYLVRYLDSWREAARSPLRPAEWWRESAIDCSRPRVFVIRSIDSEARAFLATRLPLVFENRKYSAFGPCGAANLAGLIPVHAPLEAAPSGATGEKFARN